MKKLQVKFCGVDRVSMAHSNMGKDKPKEHPFRLSPFRSIYIPSYCEGIKVGDVLRCDGLPFMSRGRRVEGWRYVKLSCPYPLYVLREGELPRSSTYKGVHFCKSRNKWVARKYINKKRIHIGYFLNEKEATIAYQNYKG